MRVFPRETEGVTVLEGDASVLMQGRKSVSGPARYCQHTVSQKKANVVLVAKQDSKWTWGIQTKHDRTIKKGEEIFFNWSLAYPVPYGNAA